MEAVCVFVSNDHHDGKLLSVEVIKALSVVEEQATNRFLLTHFIVERAVDTILLSTKDVCLYVQR